ncbi:hypothetical protein AMATHDRAFT_74708 [Amanita thiersii Skay4041]|uniref:RING-type domain-containing protein n=1 Tax=Amanita thiersii Skay4041 TaxID=703135 RepID=A0A2A9NMQ6_9AGAR|nr:hypothetical protein AMATHDRAFT_74708 [Amanita thiersii Skay4041]
MPRPVKPSQSTGVIRRSTRLNSGKAIKLYPTSSKDLRRSQRITPTELVRRERTLLQREQECKRKSDELNERILLLSKKEDEATLMMSQIAEREACAILSQLEEHFTCPLCYEIMAHPYTLNPGHCGHTFCATCILKWFFSRLHRACGGWHESVDCPICRAPLMLTPDRIPRLVSTFPFVPNRIAASMLESSIEKLARLPSPSIVKKEDSDGLWISEQTCTIDCVKMPTKPKEEDGMLDTDAWKEDGCLRAEWLKKDSDGRREINNLFQRWENLDADDFVELKRSLGV